MNRTIVFLLSLLFIFLLNCEQSYAAQTSGGQPPRGSVRTQRRQAGRYIKTLPSSRISFTYRNNPYYFSRGLIYVLVEGHYQVVDPIEGMIIPHLPEDELRVITIGKKVYYEYCEIIYKAIEIKGSVHYEIVGQVR
ncbi:MAG: DUF6515 family protein [Rikenellaceae bacterium]